MSLQHPAFVIPSICLFLATVTTILRLYTKVSIIQSHGINDYLMVITLALFSIWIALGVVAVVSGAGLHVDQVSDLNLVRFLKISYTIRMLFDAIILALKASIILQLKRIFLPSHNRTWWALQAFLFLNVLWYAGDFFSKIFRCSPAEKSWNPSQPECCLESDTLGLPTLIFNAVSDLILLLFPIHCVFSLNVPLREKLCASAFFLTGIAALSASTLNAVLGIKSLRSEDVTFEFAKWYLCAVGQITAGMLTANLIVFPRLAREVLPQLSVFRKDKSPRQKEPARGIVVMDMISVESESVETESTTLFSYFNQRRWRPFSFVGSGSSDQQGMEGGFQNVGRAL